jgi:hypothetical protein
VSISDARYHIALILDGSISGRRTKKRVNVLDGALALTTVLPDHYLNIYKGHISATKSAAERVRWDYVISFACNRVGAGSATYILRFGFCKEVGGDIIENP